MAGPGQLLLHLSASHRGRFQDDYDLQYSHGPEDGSTHWLLVVKLHGIIGPFQVSGPHQWRHDGNRGHENTSRRVKPENWWDMRVRITTQALIAFKCCCSSYIYIYNVVVSHAMFPLLSCCNPVRSKTVCYKVRGVSMNMISIQRCDREVATGRYYKGTEGWFKTAISYCIPNISIKHNCRSILNAIFSQLGMDY
jgi:hypothetical protein